MKNNLENLIALKNEYSSKIIALSEAAKEEAHQAFLDANGCQTCRGRGWVVTWDTLDCMRGSYHESGRCPEDGCTAETRAKSGLLPINNKYDSFHAKSTWRHHYTVEQSQIEVKIRQINRKIAAEEARWKVSVGKVVRVSKEGRGPKNRRVPVGTEGLVKKLYTNNWGTTKAIVVDANGDQWWPKVNQLEVVNPDPDLSFWNNLDMKNREKTGFPIVITVKKKTGRAVLVRTTTAKEFWIPFSQAPELSDSRKNQTLSVSIPMWIAEKNGLVTRN